VDSKSRGSSVGTVTGSGLDDRGSGVRFRWGARNFFYSPQRPDRPCGPPTLLSNGYHGLFPWGRSGRGVKLNTHLLNNAWSYTSIPQYAFMVLCSVKSTGTTLPLLFIVLRNVGILSHHYTASQPRVHLYRHESLKSGTLNRCYSLSVKDKILHPYKTTGKVIISFIHINKRRKQY
jgi:hypothetical protein